MTISAQDRALKRLSALVQFESDLRESADVAELGFILVNSLNKIVENEHAIFWLARSGRIEVVSGGVSIDHEAIRARWYGELSRHLAKILGAGVAPADILPEDLPKKLRSAFAENVPDQLVWMPLVNSAGKVSGGLLLHQKKLLSEADARILARAAGAASFVLAFHQKGRKASFGSVFRPFASRWVQLGLLAVVIALMFVPIELSVLAPARSVPAKPAIVSAPLDGVIRTVLVAPNQPVKQGEIVAKMETNELQAAFEVASRRAAVLAADLRRATQKAFFEEDARAQIGLLMAQLREREAERDLAKERLSRIELRAPIDGVALLADQNEWTGRPVRTGERILIVAEPSDAILEILIPVEDAVVVEEGASVAFFSSITPNAPLKAVLERVSFTASVQPDQTLAFRAEARFSDQSTAPRLGFTGTAKILADKVPLYYALFRKPAATMRRALGL